MAEQCVNECKQAPPFPQPIFNRPGLSRIRYRIGEYPDFLDAIFARIDCSVTLRKWTHRAPDDPGIALLQGAAILGDILTLYQEHYANEVFLRTASWPESVADLTRLLGYRLAPGVGGRGTFAFEVKGIGPITIPSLLPLKIELAGIKEPADFITTADASAWPNLSKFHLYRPRSYSASVSAGTKKLELMAADWNFDPAAVDAVGLKKGDKVMLMPDESMWSIDGTAYSTQNTSQTVTVSKVTRILDRLVVEFEGALQRDWDTPLIAFRINQTVRHFGHNAPEKYATNTSSGGKIDGASESTTNFTRHLYHEPCTQHDITFHGSSYGLMLNVVPLERDVPFALGAWVIIELGIKFDGPGASRPVALISRQVASTGSLVLALAGVKGSSAILTLDRKLLNNSSLFSNAEADIRDIRVTEATSPLLVFSNVTQPVAGAFTSPTGVLYFFGTSKEASVLPDRRLQLVRDSDGVVEEVRCVSPPGDFDLFGAPDAPQVWSLDLDHKPVLFRLEDFDEEHPTVTVFGNLSDAVQGKEEPVAVLGDGDGRRSFQTFPLPKPKLTFLADPAATPMEVPQLEIRVNDRQWQRVDAFYGHGPQEEIYILRTDTDGNSFVQFGDNETGSRLPSGLKNVTAHFFTGIGAHGPAKAGAKPSAGKQVTGLVKTYLNDLVSGGAPAESPDRARIAAPGTVQSLGRLVSLQDYETEVLRMSGVTVVSANWGISGGVPAVLLRVLLEAGREKEFTDVNARIEKARICRGPSGYPVVVEQAFLRYVYLDLDVAIDPALLNADVEALIDAAMGLAGDTAREATGLFGLHHRRLGEHEYASRIEAVVQNTPGVVWCRASALGRLAFGIDPATEPLPPSVRAFHGKLPCAARESLQLHSNHFSLTFVAAPAGACT